MNTTLSRSRTISPRPLAAALALTATTAAADTSPLTITNARYQFIARSAVVTDGTLFEDEFNILDTPGLPGPRYDRSETALASSTSAISRSVITQHSRFQSMNLRHDHHSVIRLLGANSVATGSARSIFGVNFTITRSTPYTLAFDISDPADNPSQWSINLALNGPDFTQLVDLSLADFNPGGNSYRFQGTLEPGEYGISFVTRMSDTRALPPSLDEFFDASIRFSVPAPASLAAPALAPLLMIRRRR
ncbi:MAG: hypothetical protein ACF8SC_07010 [Phycisphaerales bacterium JB037]